MVSQAELILGVITLWFLVLSQFFLEMVWVPLNLYYIFFQNFNIHDLSNLPKVKLLVTVHIIFISSFQNKVFSINTSFLLYNSAVYSLHSIVLSLTFTPSHFEAHGSLSSKFSLF